jgi:hypothetical protein
MRASEFIEELQELIREHGDLEVEDDAGHGISPEFWNEDGDDAVFLVT